MSNTTLPTTEEKIPLSPARQPQWMMLVITVLLMITTGTSVYFYMQTKIDSPKQAINEKNQPTSTTRPTQSVTPKPTTQPTNNPTANQELTATPTAWKTYHNANPDYAIRYPSSWSLNTKDSEVAGGAGDHRLTLSQGQYKITVDFPYAFGPSACVFDDQDQTNVPEMAELCHGEFVTFTGAGHQRRRLTQPGVDAGVASWTIYSLADGNWLNMPPIGYEAPAQYDVAVVREMDQIVKTLTQ